LEDRLVRLSKSEEYTTQTCNQIIILDFIDSGLIGVIVGFSIGMSRPIKIKEVFDSNTSVCPSIGALTLSVAL
jgi:hypothetical protein